MPGGFRIVVAAMPGAPPQEDRGRPPDFRFGPIALWSAEPTLVLDDRTVILGHIFKKGRPSVRVGRFEPGESRRLLLDKGRALLADYWGGYLLVHFDREDRVRIFRDPSGILPAYVRRDQGCVEIAGDIRDLTSPGPGKADFKEIARILASGDARGRSTCVANVDELVAGDCLVVDADRTAIEAWWSPWDHIEPPQGLNFDEAARLLRETVSDCVGTWASCFSSILLGASGGLDSSIVAAAAAPRARQLTCLTLVGPDPEGDERRYAHAAAEALGLDICDAALDLADIDVRRAVAPHHPWPVSPIFKQSVKAIHERIHSELGVDAHFTGNGGDGIFCSIRSATPFLDRFLAEGPRPGLAATLRDICGLTGADTATVLRHAWSRYRREGGRHRVSFDGSGLMPALAAQIEAAGGSHPWLDAPDGMLPGKTVHAAFLMRNQRSMELYPRASAPSHIAPLHSQPIVERCLSIPTWMWISGGRDRAVAREAFAGELPEMILRRTRKGGPGGFHLSIYRHHRAALHEQLREGVLAAAGVIDTTLLDAPDDPSWRGVERAQRILALAAAENWARWWSAG